MPHATAGILIRSTGDVALNDLRQFADAVAPEVAVEVDERQTLYKSFEPPSWIALFNSAPGWLQSLAVVAGIFVSGFIGEAGKDAWRNRSKAFAAAARGSNAVKTMARQICGLRQRVSPRTKLELALPFPDEYFGTRLVLLGKDENEVALEIALFVYHLPALERLFDEQQVNPATGVFLELGVDGRLIVVWQDRASLQRCREVIPFQP